MQPKNCHLLTSCLGWLEWILNWYSICKTNTNIARAHTDTRIMQNIIHNIDDDTTINRHFIICFGTICFHSLIIPISLNLPLSPFRSYPLIQSFHSSLYFCMYVRLSCNFIIWFYEFIHLLACSYSDKLCLNLQPWIYLRNRTSYRNDMCGNRMGIISTLNIWSNYVNRFQNTK